MDCFVVYLHGYIRVFFLYLCMPVTTGSARLHNTTDKNNVTEAVGLARSGDNTITLPFPCDLEPLESVCEYTDARMSVPAHA